MDSEHAEEFNEYFSEQGGIASQAFVNTFKYGDLINTIRIRAQNEADKITSMLESKGVNHSVYFDFINSPDLNAGAVTPREDISFIAVSLGAVLRARLLLEILMSQSHSPEEAIVEGEYLLSILRQNVAVDDQWNFIREADHESYIKTDALPETLILIQLAMAFDYIYAHESNHIMLGHTQYASKALHLDKLQRNTAIDETPKQDKLKILEMRADYASGAMFGNRIPNKKNLIFPVPEANKLLVDEYMGNMAFALTAILSGFSIAWEVDPSDKLYGEWNYPHPDFRYRVISDGIMSTLKSFNPEYSDTWFNYSGYFGNAHCKQAFSKILGTWYEFHLQTGPFMYLPKEGRPGLHPHMFSADAEVMYGNLYNSMRDIDNETGVIAYLS